MSRLIETNPVAKHARTFNKSAVMTDRKKENKKCSRKDKLWKKNIHMMQ